ncbi:GNAT family N-acetyltransferase [Aestuariimicrobium ganziense]|uniref:GNAT family N-acetyltransferase n=1 Tax=Aestuariimicrobium ganziense TaxID=2773677 RepID=UPI0019453986|nr:N-acetyltransferase [Aestuariimicrobium ganziense]
MNDPVLVSADQAEEALDLIIAQQADPATACSYVGTERSGVLAELDDLSPTWRDTLRVGLRDGRVVAAACVDVDADDTGRSWIHGPWAADGQAWDDHADDLLEAMTALARDLGGSDDHEVSAAPANHRMADLAGSRGWHRSVVNRAYVAHSDQGWPASSPQARTATDDDLAAVATLHDQAFPGTYASARGLLTDDDRTTLVLDGADGLAGYASAQVQPDGEGYLDFIVIAPSSRGRGLARGLLAAIGRSILASSPQASVNLTVRDDNPAAIALYERFGFSLDAELVGYRSHPYPPA